MTDRLKGFVVTFDKDYREDDAERILDAIHMVKGVATVAPIKSGYEDDMNRERVRMELQKKLFDVLHGS